MLEQALNKSWSSRLNVSLLGALVVKLSLNGIFVTDLLTEGVWGTVCMQFL